MCTHLFFGGCFWGVGLFVGQTETQAELKDKLSSQLKKNIFFFLKSTNIIIALMSVNTEK